MLVLLAAFGIGAGTQVAWAGHWHSYQGIDQAIVHGDKNRDGSFFGRVDNRPRWLATNSCSVGDVPWGFYATASTFVNELCSLCRTATREHRTSAARCPTPPAAPC